MFEYLVMTFTRSLQGIYLTISCAVLPGRREYAPLISSNAPFPTFKDFQSTQVAKFSSLYMTGSVADISLTYTSFSPFTSELHSCLWLLLWCNCSSLGYVCKSPLQIIHASTCHVYAIYGLCSIYIYTYMYCKYRNILYMLPHHNFVYQVITQSKWYFLVP